MKIVSEKINKIKLLKNKKGFVSIETVIAISFCLMFFIFVVEFFNYIYPTINLQIETHTLTQKAKVQGGLTNTDILNMKQKLKEKGFDETKVLVSAKTKTKDVSNVTPMNQEGTNYVKRDSDEEIIIRVEVPASTDVDGWSIAIGNRTFARKTHIIQERIYSERW